MSRVSLIEQLYVKRKSALEFNYDALWAPPIRSILTQDDINQLYRIATSLRYNGDIEKKYELIDNIMRSRGFRKAHCGTNRVVYNFLELPTFVAKVALDKVGLKDSPAEFKNQEFFKPFCCKIFEVDPTGVIAFVERVNPITSMEEFLSVSDDIFNMMLTKVIGKYVVDDLGADKFMNYGLRYNSNGYTFGPVIIDFPYAYELDGAKLICTKPINTPFGKVICNGEIDYDDSLSHLVCTKCGRTYSAKDLRKPESTIKAVFDSDSKGDSIKMRAKIMSGDKVIKDSGYSSDVYVTQEEWESTRRGSNSNHEPRRVSQNKRAKYPKFEDYRRDYYTALQVEQYNAMQNQGLFNPAITSSNGTTVSKDYYLGSGDEYVQDTQTISYLSKKGSARIVFGNEEDLHEKIEMEQPNTSEQVEEVIDTDSAGDEQPTEEVIDASDENIEPSITYNGSESTIDPIPVSFVPSIEGSITVDEQDNFTSESGFLDFYRSKYRKINPSDIVQEFSHEEEESGANTVEEEEELAVVDDRSYDGIKTQPNYYDDEDDYSYNKGNKHNHRNKKTNKYKPKKNKGFNDPNSGMSEF